MVKIEMTEALEDIAVGDFAMYWAFYSFHCTQAERIQSILNEYLSRNGLTESDVKRFREDNQSVAAHHIAVLASLVGVLDTHRQYAQLVESRRYMKPTQDVIANGEVDAETEATY